MPMVFEEHRVRFEGVATVEEAEGLLDWIVQRPSAGPLALFDLAQCNHLHTANLQVLLAADARVSAWPEDEELRSWLQAVLKHA